MLGALRHDEDVALAQQHGPLGSVLIAKGDVKLAVEDKEELIGVLVHVPVVIAARVRDPHGVVVDPAYDPGAVNIVEGSQGLIGLTLLVAIGATVIAAFYPTWRAAQVQPAWQLKSN